MKFYFKIFPARLTALTACISFLIFPSSCNYLDIVPDNVATIDYAFRMRSQAEKYLFTCYSYIPERGNWERDPGMLSGDEIWFFYPYSIAYYAKPPDNWEIARGNQSVVDPYLNYWDGENRGEPLFEGIRDCNIFLKNIDRVPDMEEREKKRWTSEVLFLKAYYHWYLLRMYGPIPIIDKNKPVSASVEDVKVYRQPVDSCFNYIVRLLDSAAINLPYSITDRISELGRVTKAVALSLKARVLVTAASPLFNGNSDYSGFENVEGESFFNTSYESSKWQRATKACKDAIDLCHSLGHSLYYFKPQIGIYNIGEELTKQMDIRNAMCEKWNTEIIWGERIINQWQRRSQPILNPNANVSNASKRPYGVYAPTMRMAELFYTKNGLPIDQDKFWDFDGRMKLDTADIDDRFYIEPGYVTARLNFNREPRFYADLGFDGGIWYGQGKYDEDNMWHVEGKNGQYSGRRQSSEFSITGYYCKKIVNFLNVLQSDGSYQLNPYAFPYIRLADLYLYYAEALNEVEGPSAEALKYINMVRERAGVPSVEDSWSNFAKDPSRYTTKEGFRKIVHTERLIEMAFEGNRYWDLRRWKEAEEVMSKPIRGWSVKQDDPIDYYQTKTLYNQVFKKKDYFWPIKEHEILSNDNLSQNPGW